MNVDAAQQTAAGSDGHGNAALLQHLLTRADGTTATPQASNCRDQTEQSLPGPQPPAPTSAATAGWPGSTNVPSRSKLASTSIGLSPAAAAGAGSPLRFAWRAAAPLLMMPASVGAAVAAMLGRQLGCEAMAAMTDWASGLIRGSEVCATQA